MYVCMYAFIRMHVMYDCMYVGMLVCMYAHMLYTNIPTPMHTYPYVIYKHTLYEFMQTCIHRNMNACVHAYVQT